MILSIMPTSLIGICGFLGKIKMVNGSEMPWLDFEESQLEIKALLGGVDSHTLSSLSQMLLESRDYGGKIKFEMIWKPN